MDKTIQMNTHLAKKGKVEGLACLTNEGKGKETNYKKNRRKILQNGNLNGMTAAPNHVKKK